MGSETEVLVVGVGMTKFEKPGRRENFDYPQMVKEAVTKALNDAGLSLVDIKQACCGYVYGDSTCGQRALYELGMTGIPMFNVNNNCSTGASALLIAKNIIESGNADCVLAVGFEKMERGSLYSKYDDRTNPLDKHISKMSELVGFSSAPVAAQLFGNAGLEHMKKYGTTEKHLAKIAYKNHRHSANNPYSQFQDVYSIEQILQSPVVYGPLTKLQCCPTSDGAAAAILVSSKFGKSRNLLTTAVKLLAMEMCSDFPSTFNENSSIKLVGYDMTKQAAERAFTKAKVSPTDINVVELHDCFSANELITYEALGLCPPGKAGELIDKNDNTYGGKYVINPSGGLISKGHPLGATGIAQCAELCWQLRGLAGPRQVKNCRLALQHNIGLGGAVVVAIYEAYGNKLKELSSDVVDPNTFKVASLFKILETAMVEDNDNLIDNVRGIYCFKVKNNNDQEGMWIINAKTGKGSVTYYGKEKPDVTFIMKDDDVFNLISGSLSPQKAFFEGKVKIIGNMGLALKLLELQKRASSKIDELRSKL